MVVPASDKSADSMSALIMGVATWSPPLNIILNGSTIVSDQTIVFMMTSNWVVFSQQLLETNEINEIRRKKKEELKKLKEPLHRAMEIYRHGAESVTRREAELEMVLSANSWKSFEPFEEMFKVLALYFDSKSMKLEPFQLELLRGAILGLAWNQLGDELFMYKHKLLIALGLATPEIIQFNPMAPNPYVIKKINDIFNFYAKPYTLGLAPRQCGKTTIISILLAVFIIFLKLSILVVAQNKNMAETIFCGLARVMSEIQTADWFNKEWECVEGRGSIDTRVFVGKGKTSRVTFVSSSPNAARGQAPDIILADEVCFVGQGALIGLVPIMGVAGRKQIHISSHKAGSWVNQVGNLIDPATGEPAYHVIDQKFKCAAHSHIRSHFCSCQAIYCPSHVLVSDSLTQLINLISPSGELELTGHVDTSVDEKMMIPFGENVTNLFLKHTIDIRTRKVNKFYICMDPTYSSGTQSSLGVASFAELDDGTTVLLAIDEVLVTGIQMAYFNMYAAITMAHLKMIKDYLKDDENVIYVPEANTYQQPNYNLWKQVRAMAEKEYGIQLMLYMQYRTGGQHWGVGRLMGANKPQIVIALHEAILQKSYAVNSVVFSFGGLIRSIFVNQKTLLRLKYKLSILAKNHTESSSVQGVTNVPTNSEELFAMSPAECVEYLFNTVAGKYFRCDKFDTVLMSDGSECLEKLRGQLLQINIKKTDRGGMKVLTGGKKSMGNNRYTRDDLFSAVLLSSGLFSKLSHWKIVHNPETEFH